MYTLCSLSKNYFVLKVGALVLESGNLFYNASVGAYIGILRQVVLVISVIVSTIAYASALRRQKSADISAVGHPAADCNENPSKTTALADNGSYCKSSIKQDYNKNVPPSDEQSTRQ